MEDKIVTRPYKWVRDLYHRLAEAAGCEHEFKVEPRPNKFNDSRKGAAYVQILRGDSGAIARVERAGDAIIQRIDAHIKASFPPKEIFTAPAAEERAKLAAQVDPKREIQAVS